MAPGWKQREAGQAAGKEPREGRPQVQPEPSRAERTQPLSQVSQAVWQLWASTPSPVSTIRGTSCGGWISPPGKGSDVKRQKEG